MNQEIIESVTRELARIAELPVEDQPAAYSVLRDRLQRVLDGKPWAE